MGYRLFQKDKPFSEPKRIPPPPTPTDLEEGVSCAENNERSQYLMFMRRD
jgi:hypothetical protein